MYPLVLSIKRKHFCGRSWCIKINTFNMRFRFYYLKSNSLSLYKQNWGEVKNSLDNLKIEFLYIKFAVGIISDNDNIFIWDSIKYIYIYEIKKIFIKIKWLESFACFSVAESCPTLYNPMDFSTLGSPVLHNLLELAQKKVYKVGDAIWPSHFLISPSPFALNLNQHQGLWQWVSSLHQVRKY